MWMSLQRRHVTDTRYATFIIFILLNSMLQKKTKQARKLLLKTSPVSWDGLTPSHPLLSIIYAAEAVSDSKHSSICCLPFEHE